MRFLLNKSHVLLVLAVLSQASSQNATNSTITSVTSLFFVVSCSGFDGNANAYARIKSGYVQGGRATGLRLLGYTEYVTSTNPGWNRVFKVRNQRGTNQVICMEVMEHNRFTSDDAIGDLCIGLDELADTGKVSQPLKNAKGGSIITVTRTKPFYYHLTLRNIPEMDTLDDARSDVYVKNYFRVGREGTDYKFKETSVIHNVLNASFLNIPFDNYVPGANQILRFKIKDYDRGSAYDDTLGEALLPVDDFLEGKKPVTFELPNELKLTVESAGFALQL